MARIMVLCLLVFLLVAANAMAGKVYMWTDENGKTHITDTPPPEGTDHERMEYKEDQYKRSLERIQRDMREDSEQLRQDLQESRQQRKRESDERQRKYDRERHESKERRDRDHNLRCEKMIRKYQNRKQELQDKLKQPHSNYQRERWASQIKDYDEEIRYWRAKMR